MTYAGLIDGLLRLRRLLVKLCAEEKSLPDYTDGSRKSCIRRCGKLFAKKIAADSGTLNDGNRAGVLAMGRDLQELVPPARGRASLTDVINTIAQAMPVEEFDSVTTVRHFAARYGRKCMFVLLSDLLFPGWEEVIRGLGASGSEGFVLQILAREELEPPYLGEVTLADLEGAGDLPLHVSKEIAGWYLGELNTFLNETRAACHRRGLGHVLLSSDLSLARSFHTYLKQEGLLC